MRNPTVKQGHRVVNPKVFYHRGDLAEYTGEVKQIHGGTFYVAVYLEGHRKGEEFVTQDGPDGPAQRAKREKSTGPTPQVPWGPAANPPVLNVVCAWCGSLIGLKPGTEGGVTHAICPTCDKKMRLTLPPQEPDDDTETQTNPPAQDAYAGQGSSGEQVAGGQMGAMRSRVVQGDPSVPSAASGPRATDGSEGFPVTNPARGPYVGDVMGENSLAQEQAGYPKMREGLKGYSDPQLLTQYDRLSRASFDRMFGHNAKKSLRLVVEELEARGFRVGSYGPESPGSAPPPRRNNGTSHAGATRSDVRSPTSTRTEVRSPTSTSTEVRSPTSTSTQAHTAGNVTVTGGAGAGANTHVTLVRSNPEEESCAWHPEREGTHLALLPDGSGAPCCAECASRLSRGEKPKARSNPRRSMTHAYSHAAPGKTRSGVAWCGSVLGLGPNFVHAPADIVGVDCAACRHAIGADPSAARHEWGVAYCPPTRRNPALMLVTGNPPTGKAWDRLEESWCRFHQKDRFDGKVLDVGKIPGAPAAAFALGRLVAVDMGKGEQRFSSPPWLACSPDDDALWIVSPEPMRLGHVNDREVVAVVYDPIRSSGKEKAWFRHDFEEPLPRMSPVGSPNGKGCRAVLLDGGGYSVDTWVRY